jgi:hypothetical protein
MQLLNSLKGSNLIKQYKFNSLISSLSLIDQTANNSYYVHAVPALNTNPTCAEMYQPKST